MNLNLVLQKNVDFDFCADFFSSMGASDFFAHDSNYEFLTFKFEVSDEEDADSLEAFLNVELATFTPITTYHFEIED